MKPVIDEELVARLIRSQFPQWADFPIRPVAAGGWDNRTFHLGEQMKVRLPSGTDYVLQVEKEQRWLPFLASKLPLPIPTPLAVGEPGEGYPWKWSIHNWLEGETAAAERVPDLRDFAIDLAQFLLALHRIDATRGPLPGAHNFQRGGPLSTYDAETRRAISALKDQIDVPAATEIWESALATRWSGRPVWIHGDISSGNLLVKEGRLSAVIDFGLLGVGDPACDLSIAWTLLSGTSRAAFRAMLPLDDGTWKRAQGWTLWKALIVAASVTGSDTAQVVRSRCLIDDLLAESRSGHEKG